MIKTKFIFLFLSIFTFNLIADTFEHNFQWHDKQNKNDNITVKIFSIDKLENSSEYSFAKDNVCWMAEELKKQNIHPYLIKIENNTESRVNVRITESFFSRNLLILSDYTYERELIIHPTIALFLNFIILSILEIGVIGTNLYLESPWPVIIATSSIVMLSAITLSIKPQIDNHNKYNNSILYQELKSLNYCYKTCSITKNSTLYIPIFVSKSFQSGFKKNLKSLNLKLEENILTIK